MKKKNKIIPGVVFFILLCLALLVYSQWNSIAALIDSFKYTNEEVAQKVEQNKQQVQEYIDKNEDIVVRDLTEDESKAVNEGSITEEKIVEILTTKPEEQKTETQPEVQPENPTPEVAEPQTPVTDEKSPSQIISESIAKLYVQKSIYLGKLDAIEAEVRGIYIAEGQHTPEERAAAKQRMLAQYLPRVASWEAECDATVYGIIDEIKAAVEQAGQDISIVEKLKQSYLEEKKAKKTYFINRYMD